MGRGELDTVAAVERLAAVESDPLLKLYDLIEGEGHELELVALQLPEQAVQTGQTFAICNCFADDGLGIVVLQR